MMNDDQRLAAGGPGRRDAARAWRRPAGLAVLAAAAVIGLAACGGGSGSPQVASLGKNSAAPAGSSGGGSSSSSGGGSNSGSGGGSSSGGGTTGDPAQLLQEWTACMRSHGDPNQAEPTIDASKVIHVTIPSSVPGGVGGVDRNTSSGPGVHCMAYMRDASAALQGGHLPKAPTQAKRVKYAKCMRANGIPDYPDPGPNGQVSFSHASGSDLNPSNPVFKQAAKTCAAKTGVNSLGSSLSSGTPPPGSIDWNYPGFPQHPIMPVSNS